MTEKGSYQIAVEEEYARIGRALKASERLEWLRDVWLGSQADIAVMPAAWRAELTAEKDRVKTRLQRNSGTGRAGPG